MAHVVSTRSHARIVNIDPSEALSMDGVVDFISHEDVPAQNNYAVITAKDETVFAEDKVGD